MKDALFNDRVDAGIKLATKLKIFANKKIVVLGLPRGGVVTASVVAKKLNSLLDIVITRKIGHPNQPEFAIAAVGESGSMVGNMLLLSKFNTRWLSLTVEKEFEEISRRQSLYKTKKGLFTGKTAIIVDDGIATGLTVEAAIEEVRRKKARKIIVATPIIAKDTYERFEKKVDIVALEVAPKLRAISQYYQDFPQVTDVEVVSLLKK